jgi:hypothetical protein
VLLRCDVLVLITLAALVAGAALAVGGGLAAGWSISPDSGSHPQPVTTLADWISPGASANGVTRREVARPSPSADSEGLQGASTATSLAIGGCTLAAAGLILGLGAGRRHPGRGKGADTAQLSSGSGIRPARP